MQIDAEVAQFANKTFPLPDEEHARLTATFAASLFDALRERLNLPQTDRALLIAGVYWHDIGLMRGARDPLRRAAELIAQSDAIEFAGVERSIVASIARYHRGQLPTVEHEAFAEMTADEQRRVRRLSAIARLAVALDASYLGVVDDITVDAVRDTVRVAGISSEAAQVERDALRQAGSAFTNLTYLPIQTDVITRRQPPRG